MQEEVKIFHSTPRQHNPHYLLSLLFTSAQTYTVGVRKHTQFISMHVSWGCGLSLLSFWVPLSIPSVRSERAIPNTSCDVIIHDHSLHPGRAVGPSPA